jgi:hypothetical protein
MKSFIYKRIGSYEEEVYLIKAKDEECAKNHIDNFKEFQISMKRMERSEITEINTSREGIEYITSYSE